MWCSCKCCCCCGWLPMSNVVPMQWETEVSQFNFAVLPAFLRPPHTSQPLKFHQQLMRYNSTFEGVPISYSDVVLEERGGMIGEDRPAVHCHVRWVLSLSSFSLFLSVRFFSLCKCFTLSKHSAEWIAKCTQHIMKQLLTSVSIINIVVVVGIF